MYIKVNETPHVIDGYYIQEYILGNNNGFELRCTNFGATLTHILWPNKKEKGHTDILLGYDTVDSWFTDKSSFGASCGRCCNRIREGKFELDGKEYHLNINRAPHHLHGGLKGYSKCVWRAYPEQTKDLAGVRLYYLSKDGEENYPGNLAVEAFIALSAKNEIIIEYKAKTDALTICNITAHPYFNLSGANDILDHELMIPADKVTAIDTTCVPTGEYISVAGTEFDFKQFKKVGKHIDSTTEQLACVKGYDHNFVLNEINSTKPSAILKDESTKRQMNIYTNQPGVQFYSGNHLAVRGKQGTSYGKHAGLCLETQGFPNAINIPNFPSVELNMGEEYHSWTKLELVGMY